jgi:3-oxoacyl-ACP reductase-like protein
MPLELAFATKTLREICESEVKASRELGVRVAEKLKRRLADLRAASCVNDLVAGRRRTRSSRNRQMALNLNKSSKIILCSNHNTTPILESGNVDWSKVTRVKILRIEGAHD